jgi:hypothetical protein
VTLPNTGTIINTQPRGTLETKQEQAVNIYNASAVSFNSATSSIMRLKNTTFSSTLEKALA